MKKIIAVTLISLGFCFFASSLQAQPYQQSVGLRVGSANGLSWQQFFGRSHTGAEALLVYRRGGMRMIGMLTQHIPLGRHSDTYLYLGLGGHAGANGFLRTDDYHVPVYGVDAMLGFTYVFPYAPLALSVDLKPMFELRGQPAFSGNNAGVSLRLLID